MSDREDNLLRPLTENSLGFYLWVGTLAAIVLWGGYAYLEQLRRGLIVTGMRDEVSWGLYITNFVFFIGISHAGTLISAILRVTRTEWRRPITRLAEAITVFALCVGAPMVIVDLGRPERILNIFRYGRIQSPILWDVLSVGTYLAGCILYLYIPMIPDFALLAERAGFGPRRRGFYRALSLGWSGTAEQQALLEKAITTMAVVIIPLAVSVHTVVSWIFAMTLRPGWSSSIFGPYFVVGAIYSGAAAVVLSMYVLRRVLRLENYLQPLHFRNLGLLLLSFSLLYLYFNVNEYLTVAYKFPSPEKLLLFRLFFGDYAPLFWTVQAIGVVFPLLLLIAVLGPKRYREFTVPGVALASFLVVIGAWAKRYLIVIPTLSSPFLPAQGLPWDWAHYRPTWVEWSITAAALAVFLLIYTLFAKLFPMVSMWETREGEQPAEGAEAPETIRPPRWSPIRPISVILLACVLAGALPARAQTQAAERAKKPQPTMLSLEWQAAPEKSASASAAENAPAGKFKPGRVQLFVGWLFGPLRFGRRDNPEANPAPAITVTATLRDARGLPLAYQPVSFALRTSFGNLSYGSRPTNEQGQAELIVRDRRYGKFAVEAAYAGSDALASSAAEIPVDFGPRPAPRLPRQGVLISPYPTAAVGLPFVIFYGIMWVVFAYAFGVLILWRLRRASRHPNPR